MSKYSETFLNYLMEQEHGNFLRGDAPALHASPEGGNATVGFGHKLTNAEVNSGKVYGYDIYTMTPEQAQEVMFKDLEKHEASLKREIGAKDFNSLDQTRQEMLLDFQYNLGSAKDKFPTFTQAVIDNDVDTMNQEYKRYFTIPGGEPRELRQRNNAFAVTFLPEAEGVREFEDLEVSTQPGVLDFQLPEPTIPGSLEEPISQEPEDLTMEELQGRKTYLGRLFD
jgi:GH24 family phage-related lysozyme (muramidase)